MKKIFILLLVSVISLTVILTCGFSAVYNVKEKENNVVNLEYSNDLKEAAKEFNISAPSAYVVEYHTGTVIYEKNAEERKQIASMVKIMTALLAFEAIDEGLLSFDKEIVISDNAAGMGGSQLFLDAGSKYKVTDLLKGVIVVSANDASVALAEEISGSEEEFVSKMNEKAELLGMNNTMFVNATGLPADGQYSCAKDVSLMTRELLKHKEYYNYSKIWLEDFTHPSGRVTELANTNKLIRFYKGCDSGKTGFTNDAMFCLSASASRNNMRIVSTVIGAPTSKDRFFDVSTLFNYAFGKYENKLLLKGDDLIENNIVVNRGKDEKITIGPKNDVYVFGEKGEFKNIKINFELPETLTAPIVEGQLIGKAVIYNDDVEICSIELVAKTSIEKESFGDILKRILDNWNIINK